MIRERILFRLFFSLLLLLSFSPFCTYEPTSQIHPKLESCFEAQRQALYEQFKDSMEIYVSNAYAQYVGTFNFYQLEISSLEAQLTQNTTLHNEILDRLKNRNAANEHLNTMLEELMEDAGSAHLVKPFVNRLYVEMQKDELTLERQYLSFEEALAMQGVLRYEYVG